MIRLSVDLDQLKGDVPHIIARLRAKARARKLVRHDSGSGWWEQRGARGQGGAGGGWLCWVQEQRGFS
jgi:hypothetical protein